MAYSQRVMPLLVCLLVIFLAACRQAGVDTIYINGKVYTVDETEPWAEAFAVTDGRFFAVGDDEEISSLQGRRTTVVDLAGKLILPGLVEDHIHPDMVVENRMNIEIDASMSYGDFRQKVLGFLDAKPDSKWVFGGMLNWLQDNGRPIVGWDQPSHHSIIDVIVNDRPAFFWDIGGHAALVNSWTMEHYGITLENHPPEGGSWDTDADGNLTGVIRETAANQIWEEFLKQRPTPEVQARVGFAPVIRELNSYGFTSMTDVWARPWNLEAYQVLEEAGELNIRISVYLTDPIDWVSEWLQVLSRQAIEAYRGYQTGMIDMIGVKFIMDGSAAGQTAMMIDPFIDTANRGFWRTDPDYFLQKILEYDALGLTVRAHAVGDRAIRTVLAGIESTRRGGSSLRHSVSHTVFVNPEDMDRFGELGVVADMSPYFWMDGPHIEAIRQDVGDERLGWVFPMAQLHQRGVMMSAGSDWPVSAPEVWGAIESMITRLPPGGEGKPLNPAAGIDLDTAIHIFTMGGAYAQYREEEIGSITVGKFADFIVLDQNIFEIGVNEIHKTRVRGTYLSGKEIYRAE